MKARRFQSIQNLVGLIAALIAVFIGFSTQVPTFATLANLELIARQSVVVPLAALGMTYVIIVGGIDLSVGSIAALSGVVVAKLVGDTAHPGMAPLLAAVAGVLAGLVCGVANGLLITRLRVVPFIVTLGTYLSIRGGAKWLGNEQKVDARETWLNNLLSSLGPDERWHLLPWGVWFTLSLAFLMAFVLKSLRFGRHVVAVGSNEAAARLCGVPVERVKLGVYALSGLFAGLAGLMNFSRLTVGDPTALVGLELDAIAAVVIGGASLSGGEGSIAGSMIGALIMSVLRAGAGQMGLPNYIQEIVTGGIIVLAVWLDRLRKSGQNPMQDVLRYVEASGLMTPRNVRITKAALCIGVLVSFALPLLNVGVWTIQGSAGYFDLLKLIAGHFGDFVKIAKDHPGVLATLLPAIGAVLLVWSTISSTPSRLMFSAGWVGIAFCILLALGLASFGSDEARAANQLGSGFWLYGSVSFLAMILGLAEMRQTVSGGVDPVGVPAE